MRVSETMLFHFGLSQLQRQLASLLKAQGQVSSGTRVSRPSDDPIAHTQILSLRKTVAQVDQHLRNINEGERFLSASETVLQEAESRLQRAHELAIDMANGSKHPADRNIAASEIKQIFDQMVSIANTVHNGQYLFSGNKTNIKPFDFQDPELEWKGEYIGTAIPAEGVTIPADDPDDPNDIPANTLNITVDGVTAAITLDAGDYDGAALATEIQTKINEHPDFEAAGITVMARFDVDHLVITSDAIGGRSGVTPIALPPPAPQEIPDPEAVPRGDARTLLGFIDGKSRLTGEEYKGDGGELPVVIEPEVRLIKNLPGPRVFKGEITPTNLEGVGGDEGEVGGEGETDPTSSSEGADIFAELLNLQTALEKNNVGGIQAAINGLARATEQVSQERAEIGIRLNRLEQTKTKLEDVQLAATGFKSDLEDVDLSKAISDLAQQNNALEASRAVMARIIQQPTLLNFLR